MSNRIDPLNVKWDDVAPPEALDTSRVKWDQGGEEQHTKGFRTTLQFGPFDTGVELPESVSLGLAGAGKRMFDIGTLGLSDQTDADKQLGRSTPGMIGGGIADLTTLALPAMKGAQLLSRAPIILGLPQAARTVLSNAAVTGGVEAATRPGGPGQRAENFAEGALLSTGADVAGGVARRLVGGPLSASSITPDAAKLIAEGVPVPPWKATDSQRARAFAERAKASLFGGPIIKDAEHRAIRKWNENLIRNATPPQPVKDEAGNILRWKLNPVTEVSDNSLNMLRDRFSEAYDAVYAGRVIPIDQKFAQDVASTLHATQRYYPSEFQGVSGIAAKVSDLLSATNPTTTQTKIVNQAGAPFTQTHLGHAGVTPGAVRQAIDAVQVAIDSAWKQGNAERVEALDGLHNALLAMRERALPPEVQSSVKEVNRAYQRFLQLQRAESMLGAQKAGLVTPSQIMSAQKALDTTAGKAAFARKNVPGQREALVAERVLGSELPTVGPGTAEKMQLAAIMSSPFALLGDFATAGTMATLASPMGQRYAFGLYPWQRQFGPAAGNALADISRQGGRAFALDEF